MESPDGTDARARIFWPVLITVILSDIITKWIAVRDLYPRGVPREVFGDVVRLTLVFNRGAAFGINSALGNLFGAPEGEGLFGVTYRATGPFTDPDIDINPLSAIAPGFLRGMFEPRTPTHELEPPSQ